MLVNMEQTPSILVVDDDRSNLDVLAHILKSQYKVQVTKSGTSAVKKARALQPDLILLDIVMPDMSGYEVLAELKASDSTRHIPVIFITGLNNVEDEEKGFLMGAVDYIVKPFKTTIVKARVRTHLRIVKQIRTIERLCMVDALTDIPNRRNFDSRLQMEWNRASRDNRVLTLIILDVDNFKAFNDTYGHPQGDVALQCLASGLATHLKRASDFMARIGGEEFAVILPETDINGGFTVAEELRSVAQNMLIPALHNTDPLSVTISLGVSSTYPNPNVKAHEFIAHADKALYQAKHEGRNRVCGNIMEPEILK